MKRKTIPQISDAKWFPAILRTCMIEFMTWFVTKVNAAKPFLPIIEEGLHYANNIVVINTGVGAGFETLDPLIDKKIKRSFVDIINFKADEEGLYVLVNSFHKLNPQEARNLLQLVYEKRQPIAILEGNNDSLWQVFGMVVIVPISVILTAPFVKPFRVSRMLFTYLIPILPIVTFVDGFIALFKLYAPDDLDELVKMYKSEGYKWRSGKMENGRGGKIIYLLGYPL